MLSLEIVGIFCRSFVWKPKELSLLAQHTYGVVGSCSNPLSHCDIFRNLIDACVNGLTFNIFNK